MKKTTASPLPYQHIFTPQGMLGEVSKNPNLDFLMNIFNIPRVYSVSGFGEWNVGRHTVATAFLALFWAKFSGLSAVKRDRLVTMALMHDLHEAVTGDILPYFKTPEVKEAVEQIQGSILKAFTIEEDEELKKDLKLVDLISFLYEIAQSSPRGMDVSKRKLLEKMYARQKETVFEYAQKAGLEYKMVKEFLIKMEL